LATKVVDNYAKLKRTLCHECCHAGTWSIDHIGKPPHGANFKYWAGIAMSVYPDLEITTCHNYEINYKFNYQCTNANCLQSYGRHSDSIDINNQRCGKCRSALKKLAKLTQDGTPVAKRPPTGFALFVKENFATFRAKAPPRTPHGDIMRMLSEAWKKQKPKKQEENCIKKKENREMDEENEEESLDDLQEKSDEEY